MWWRPALRAPAPYLGHIGQVTPPPSLWSQAVIFSGIQPTGVPHLGNYLGALKRWVDLQDQAYASQKLFFSIVDLHALTAPLRLRELKQMKWQTLAMLLAIGLDPEKCTIFFQSSVPAHSELMWILSCKAPMGYLSRMTQWKSKLGLSDDANLQDHQSKTQLKLGLMSYPVLQAADILLYRATHVPVGEDQNQHLEFTRDLAQKFNHEYNQGGDIFFPPQTLSSPAKRIMSLQTPTTKMSKSDLNPRSRILLTDTPEEITAKINGAKTDSEPGGLTYDPVGRPGVSNLFDILAALHPEGGGRSAEAWAAELRDEPLRHVKLRVAEAVAVALDGVRHRYARILERDDGMYLRHVAEYGAEKARARAAETMEIVHSAVGL